MKVTSYLFTRFVLSGHEPSAQSLELQVRFMKPGFRLLSHRHIRDECHSKIPLLRPHMTQADFDWKPFPVLAEAKQVQAVSGFVHLRLAIRLSEFVGETSTQ